MTITVSTDKSKLDVGLIHRYLSEESYWAQRIPRDVVQRSIDNALCFAAYDGEALVGFARVVTDYAVFAYLGDVFVIESHRGRGVSKMIMKEIMEHPGLQGLRRWSLLTSDAHGLYRQFGFGELANPEKHMELAPRNPYRDPPVTHTS
jgi:GNAT superfamily N-acetyltransferase